MREQPEVQSEVEESTRWQRRFFTIWSGQALSIFGTSIVQFALVWWLTETTKSATVLAIATLFAMLPQIVLGPLAGTLVDRWNRRTVMMVSDSLAAVASLVLVVLFATGAVQIWHVLVVMTVRSAMGAFQNPAMQASTSLMVPKKHLSRIGGLNSILGGVVNIAAPPIGALFVMAMPIQNVVLIDVLSALPAVIPLFFFAVPQPLRAQAVTHAESGQKSTAWGEFKAGLAYLRSWPALMIVLGMAMAINFLLTPAFSLLPLYITNHFNGNADQLAAMNSMWGVGMIAGGILLSVWGGFKRRIYTSMFGLVGIGAGALMIGLAPSHLFLVAVVGMTIGGISNPLTNGPLHAIFQSSVAPEMQGRIMGLIGSMAVLMNPLSLLVAGPLADLIGIPSWYIVSGVVCIAMAILGVSLPIVVNIEGGKPAHDSTDDVESRPQPVEVAPTGANAHPAL